MKRIIALVLLAACSFAHAQFGIVNPAYGPAVVAPDTIMPKGKIYVNLSTIQPRAFGESTNRLLNPYPAAPNYTSQAVNGGQFRALCAFSHVAFDDPIVFPGRSGLTHLHAFYGNTNTRSSSDLENMASSGNSTCGGGTLNRTGYWLPPPIYHCPTGAGGCDASRDGQILAPQEGNFYYKCDAGGSTGCDNGQWFAPGLRMITGSATNSSATGLPGASRLECWLDGAPSNGAVYPGYAFDHIPTSAEAAAIGGCNGINMFISFPDCWNGIDLDVPDHISHMRFKSGSGCTDPLFPVLFPQVTLNAHLDGIAQADLDFLRLSSDPAEEAGVTQSGSTTTAIKLDATASAVADYYVKGWIAYGSALRYVTAYDATTKTATVSVAFASAPVAGAVYAIRNPAGRTVHSDWVNGWSQDPNVFGPGIGSITDVIFRNCYRKNHTPKQNGDCHNHHLGNPSNVDDTTPANMWGIY